MDSVLPRTVIGMPAWEYHAQNDFDSRSFLVAVAKYGGSAQKWMDEGHSLFGGNSATKLGTKFDTAVMAIAMGFEVDKVIVTPPADALTSNGQRRGKAYEEYKAKLREYEVDCNEDEAFTLRTMIAHTLNNKAARDLIENTTESQLSVFFELGGHPLKVRPDGVIDQGDRRLWWDLKSTSATWDRVASSVVEYGYSEQEWLYVEGAKAIGFPHFRMPFVFTQTVPPFHCEVFFLPEEYVAESGQRLLRVMEEVRLRRSTGEYMPVEHGEINELTIPAWAARKHEEVVA
jgi:hypothetical protein